MLIDLGSIGGVPLRVTSYGLAMLLGMILAWLLVRRLGRSVDPRVPWSDLVLGLLVSGLLGAKLLQAAVRLPELIENPAEWGSVVLGGGVWLGGVAGALAYGLWFADRHRLAPGRMFNVLFVAVPLGHAIGRVGCLLAGCCYGAACSLPWAVTYSDPLAAASSGTPLGVPLHPAPVYESLAELLNFGICWALWRRDPPPWTIPAAWLGLYGTQRFFLEMLRGDSRGALGPLSTSQWLALAMAAAALVLWLTRIRPAARPARAAAMLLAAGLALAAPSRARAQYEIVPFEFPGAPITGGRGINDTGCEAGYYQTDAANFLTAHALRRCGGVLETVDPPTSTGDRRAFDINDAGTLVGSALRASGNDGFELSAGVYTWVEYPGADQTVIRGINNAGDIVGEYEGIDGIRHAFQRLTGVFTNIDVPGAVESRARAINDHGDIVGHYDDLAGDRHAFHRTPAGVYTTIDYPGADQTVAGGINNAGDIVGTYFDLAGTPHGFLLTPTGFEPFDVPGAASTLAIGINESNQLTGEYTDNTGTRRGFVATPPLFADGFETGDLTQWSATQP